MEKVTLSKKEVAEYLGVSVRTISTLTKQKELPYIKTGDAKSCRVLYPRAAVDKWLESKTTAVACATDVVRRRPRRVN